MRRPAPAPRRGIAFPMENGATPDGRARAHWSRRDGARWRRTARVESERAARDADRAGVGAVSGTRVLRTGAQGLAARAAACSAGAARAFRFARFRRKTASRTLRALENRPIAGQERRPRPG